MDDKKWVTYENIVRKRQWLNKNEPLLLDLKANIRDRKVLLCVRWNCGGIIYYELLKPNLMITANRYILQLQRL